jgi:agmatine deiminase
MVLEGGGIETDGAGSLLTTESCLLSPQRNPSLNKQQIEERLKTLFGIERVLWLKYGQLAGDDTDGHIDTLARFCDAQTIAYVACDDPRDEHYVELQALEAELKALRTREGKPYRLVPLPWPQAKFSSGGKRLPASYANFLMINDAVLAPTYDDPADAEVLVRLRTCFPDREVIGIPCLPLIKQYGSLHCVTMQLPAGVLSA